MSAETAAYREVIERLPTDSTLILRGISWDDYEELLAAVGEAPGLRISYDQGTMQIMTPSSEHESYVRLIERLVDRVSSKLRIKVLSFGSATMKHSRWRKGSEPDACFYVQSASRIGNRVLLDFTNDPKPDIVVEVDERDRTTQYGGSSPIALVTRSRISSGMRFHPQVAARDFRKREFRDAACSTRSMKAAPCQQRRSSRGPAPIFASTWSLGAAWMRSRIMGQTDSGS